jgi:hypothetical protein
MVGNLPSWTCCDIPAASLALMVRSLSPFALYKIIHGSFKTNAGLNVRSRIKSHRINPSEISPTTDGVGTVIRYNLKFLVGVSPLRVWDPGKYQEFFDLT